MAMFLNTVCPRSLVPFYRARALLNLQRLLGHPVSYDYNPFFTIGAIPNNAGIYGFLYVYSTQTQCTQKRKHVVHGVFVNILRLGCLNCKGLIAHAANLRLFLEMTLH